MEASPTSFALRLSSLPPDDLAALLSLRPEAAALAAQPRVTWGTLAAALSAPRGVHEAMAGLDRMVDQVLQLACAYGGRLTPAQALAEDLDTAALARAALELRRHGLGFPEADGALVVPRCVLAQVTRPAELGYHAAMLLDHATVDDLRGIATHLGVRRSTLPSRKGQLIGAVLARFADREVVRALAATAPSNARAALDELRAAGGTSDRVRPESVWHRTYAWNARLYSRPSADDGPAWLLARGLVLAREQWSAVACVPLEVEHALRGRVFASWPAEPPALSLVPLREDRHPAELVAEMSALLAAWRREPPPVLRGGGVPKRELARLARVLGCGVDWAADLAMLAGRAGLIGEREVTPEKRSRSYRHPHVLQPRQAVHEVTADAWDGLESSDRWLLIVRTWSRSLEGAARLAPEDRPWRLVLPLLGELPPGTGAGAAELGALLAWRHPADFGDPEAAARFVAAVGVTLRALGLGGAEPAIGLAALARAVLLADGPIDTRALRTAFPEPVSTCTVTADHRVIVVGTPTGTLADTLARICEVVSVHPAHVYRLSETSLRGALDGGWTGERITSALRGHSTTELPQNVVALIEDVARRHGRVRVGAAAQYLVADDPAQLEQILRSRAGRVLALRRVAPTVAVADAKSLQQILGTLRAAGLMPVADGAAAGDAAAPPAADPLSRSSRIPAPPGPEGRSSPSGPAHGLGLRVGLGAGPALGAAEVAKLAARLRAAPKAVQDELETDASPVRDTFADAIQQRELVLMEYRDPQSRARQRLVIQPQYVSGTVLEAYDHGRMRRFDLRGVVWAEALAAEQATEASLWS